MALPQARTTFIPTYLTPRAAFPDLTQAALSVRQTRTSVAADPSPSELHLHSRLILLYHSSLEHAWLIEFLLGRGFAYTRSSPFPVASDLAQRFWPVRRTTALEGLLIG